MNRSENLDSAWCAYAFGKEAWKHQGNSYTAEELRKIDEDDSMVVYQPAGFILSAD